MQNCSISAVETGKNEEGGMKRRRIALFDLDGTLTKSRKPIEDDMMCLLQVLKENVSLGVVSGSDLGKIAEQLGGKHNLNVFDYVFAENGVMAYRNGEDLINSESISKQLGEGNLSELINFVLSYISGLDLPFKRGTFVEYRNGMLNFCPVGRNCSSTERSIFAEYDKLWNVRQRMVCVLREKFENLDLKFSIGGQISIDCFPKGWDKSYCLQFLENEFDEICFFGDKTEPGGNDYEIFIDKRTIGFSVDSPESTILALKKVFPDVFGNS